MRDTALPGAPDLGRFVAVDAWVFDLDNTLYPRETNLFAQVDRRIHEYVARLLNVSPEEAQRVQKDYYQRYGTTLRGLMQEHHIAADDFLEFVHNIDHSPLVPNPKLGSAIERLPGRKFILTNGSRAHAEKVAGRLGITRHFEDIFDIVRADLLPKPNRETYHRFVTETGVTPARAAMFEDLARNLAVPHDLGMATVLVVPAAASAIVTEDWEQEGHDAPFVDFTTDDLTQFLEGILAMLTGRNVRRPA